MDRYGTDQKAIRYNGNIVYVSIIPDRNRSVQIFISDRPSVSIGTNFFWHDFHNGEGLERSDSGKDTRSNG